MNSKGEVKLWVDASEPGTGNWLKYVRSCSSLSKRNIMAVQSCEEIYYKAKRDIKVGEELLLHNDDAVIPESEQGKYYIYYVCMTPTNCCSVSS